GPGQPAGPVRAVYRRRLARPVSGPLRRARAGAAAVGAGGRARVRGVPRRPLEYQLSPRCVAAVPVSSARRRGARVVSCRRMPPVRSTIFVALALTACQNPDVSAHRVQSVPPKPEAEAAAAAAAEAAPEPSPVAQLRARLD